MNGYNQTPREISEHNIVCYDDYTVFLTPVCYTSIFFQLKLLKPFFLVLLVKCTSMDLIKTIEENTEIKDYSDDSDAEVEVNKLSIKMFGMRNITF